MRINIDNKKVKVHLNYGVNNTKCGKELDEVNYTIDVNLCTCKSCLKYKHKDYPKQ